MKKKKHIIASVLILLIISLVFVFVLGKYNGNRNKTVKEILKVCPRYKIDVAFYPDTKKIDVKEQISIVNNKQTKFTELYFHLYPNAFKTIEQVPFPKDEMEKAYPEGFAPGYITMNNLSVNESQAIYEIENTILKVYLDEAFELGDELILNLDFQVIIPPSRGRFGYGQNTFNIANWYPILAVYDEKGWHKDPYYSIGDPFYSEVGIYDVNIKAPQDYVIAATGNLGTMHEIGKQNIWNFKAELVRDFAWFASPNFEMRKAGGKKTHITSFYMKGKEDYGIKALEYGQKALLCFNKYFGEYPYSDYSIVAADFYIGGMEYPNLVIIGEEFYGPGEFLEYVVVHETAHQWWYGLVGNNQILEAWLDEALAEYSTFLYYEYYYGRKIGQNLYEQTILGPYRLYEMSSAPSQISRPLSDFSDWVDYSATVYNKGAIMLMDLEDRMSRGKFHEALRYYFENNLYKNATATDFINALNNVTGTDWTDFIYEWLNSTETLDKVS